MDRGPSAPPPAYNQVAQTGFPLSFVDFSPVMTEQGGVFSSPKYERFDILINKANGWLQQNPGVRVVCCESVESKAKMNTVVADTSKSTFYEYGERSNWFHRTLRLFIRSSGPGDPPTPHQIGYLNVVPACTDPGGVFSMPKFADFGTTIANINAMFRQNPIQGRILNIETQDVKFKTWGSGVDPDSCFWREYGEATTYFLNVIRIFFEAGPPAYEEIGTADFVPDCLKPGGFLSIGCFQTISETMQKANHWIQQQQGVRITNVQSIDYKVSSSWGGDRIDTMRSLFREYGEHTTRYLRIVRVCWTRVFGGEAYTRPLAPVSYRTFLPAQLTASGVFATPRFETQPETMKRALAWLQATGARVLSAETVPVRMYSGNQHGNTEQTYTYNRGERSEYWLIVIRVFLDGVYNDPPPETLPPLPQIQQAESDCCTIL